MGTLTVGSVVLVPFHDSDFEIGSLHHVCFARPGKLFTANASLVVRNVGVLTKESRRHDLQELA